GLRNGEREAGDMEGDRLPADMRQEGLDAVEDTLARMNDAALGLRNGAGGGSTRLEALRKDAHNLKGLGAAFGFPGVALIAHRLEDFMAASGDDRAVGAGVQAFLDRIAQLCDGDVEASGDRIARMVRALPTQPGGFDPAEIEIHDVEILLVAPRGAATRYVMGELSACGYRVTAVSKPSEALEFAIQGRPDLIVVSAILEQFDGVDLVCALRAMPSTSAVPVAFLTSLGAGDDRLRHLPADVPVLTKGGQFSDDVANALVRLGIV
ncbi:MAG: Hpt domain-containing protein, partial [Sphingomonadales bacterium]